MRNTVRCVLFAAIPLIVSGMEPGGQDAAPLPAALQGQAAPENGQPKPVLAAETDASKTPVTAPTPGGMNADDKSFVIGPEDQLEIIVWADTRIGGAFLVRPDGKISMNLVGEVQAAGRTPAELGKEISEVLKQKEILRRPDVNVKILQVNSKKFSINGEVMKTGAFPLVVPTRIMDALVNAGGFKDFANKKDIVILRGAKRLKFNWNEVVKGKKMDQNVYLEPGDIIIVK